MRILDILSLVEEQDPEVFERLDTRRQAMRSFAGLGKKIALTSLPFAFGSMLNKAYGQTPGSDVIAVLNFALTLEYLEWRFYDQALNASGLIPSGAPRNAITTIRDHEKAHVDFLRNAISSSGGTPVSEPVFDFTAGNGSGNGPFAGVFSNYQLFLAVAQTFEDTGVRAYKGQAGNLISADDVLTAALRIHSVEARHASHIRQMRNSNNFGDLKPWITGNDTGGIGAAVAASYAGEEITTQAGVNIVNIGGQAITADAASEAFDEPLNMSQVLAIVEPFIV